MSASDILDVLNVQRGEGAPAKKKQKTNNGKTQRQSGMARELYNLLGPNTPPVSLSAGGGSSAVKDKLNLKPSPWSRIGFTPQKSEKGKSNLKLYHWVKGSKELLEQEAIEEKPYFFDKFDLKPDIPELVDEETYDRLMEEIRREKSKNSIPTETTNDDTKPASNDNNDNKTTELVNGIDKEKESRADLKEKEHKEDGDKSPAETEWSYEETKQLFVLCNDFELKWHAIFDRFTYPGKTLEDLKEHFYLLCGKILKNKPNVNPQLLDSLNSYSKSKEIERKQYLENLLTRTPAEIAEEESLVVEARRFELAAKKMLVERSNLLTLFDSPQTSQSVQQYRSSQGLTNLYNSLMIMDKHQKRKQLSFQKGSSGRDPIPPSIPVAASSSFKKDRGFQTHLQQYLSGLLKQNQANNNGIKQEKSAVQQLLAKKLTVKEEEAYGLYYHANEKLTPGVILRSGQRLPGLLQRQSTLKSVSSLLQELDIPTVGGTNWKPIMPTRKTMTKFDELLRASATLLEVKKAKDKLESEIKLIKSQRGLQ